MSSPAHCGSPVNRSTELDPDVHWECRRCTACCRWPGDVRIDDDEIARAADFLGLDEHAFIQRFTRLRTDRKGLSLLEKDNHECIMLDGDECRIHPVKPRQCAGFPNLWRFPGWHKVCQAVPVPRRTPDSNPLPPS